MFRIITGIIVLAFGLWLVYVTHQISSVGAIYGVIIAGVGVAILLNDKEDDIEEINNDKSDNYA